ncbi:19454_t:CDS:2, partial [Racocetra fulgida]
AEKLAEFGRQHITRGIGRVTNLVIQQAKGSYLYDVQGKKFLDFTTGIGVTSLAVQEQAAKLNHGQAVEGAIKLARHATKKQNLIVFQGGFHGRSIGAMSLTTSKVIYKAGFGPLMPGVYVTPYPYCFTCPVHRAVPQKYNVTNCCDNPIEQIELLLKQQTAPDETAAMIVEPILGEGGYVEPPKSFFPKLREICTKNNILLIFDEVQTGFGRTGKMFAAEHFGILPDIIVMAKGIASGFPLSGIVANKKLMDIQPPGSMGGTYTGNAVSCAAAIATLEVFEEEKILENFTGVPHGFATAVTREAFEKHDMIILTTGVYETLRLIPPLTVTADEINDGIERLSIPLELIDDLPVI